MVKSKQWTCESCKLSFSRHFTLKRHIVSLHMPSKEDNNLVCNDCKKRFNRLENLKRHLNKTRSCIERINRTFKCDSCDYITKKKSNLVRHERRHKDPDKDDSKQELFECFACEFMTKNKSSLVVHLRQHDEVNLKFECTHCSRKFSSKRKLTEHIRSQHLNITPVNKKVLKCLTCGETFKYKSILLNHYQKEHHIVLEWEELTFGFKDEFEKWKANLQRSTRTQFISRNLNKSSTCISQEFWCHRSGCYVSSCESVKRKRLLKEYGSKKLNGICPAEISVKEYTNGKIIARIQKTHVGHCLEDPKEIRHIYLDKMEKDDIAARISAGIPIAQVKIQQTLSDKSQEISNRSRIVNYDDIYNAGRTRGVLQSAQYRRQKSITNDGLDIDTFISQHQDSILFLKPQCEEDIRYNILAPEDFAVVLMNEWQEHALKQYAWKVVCMDGTHGINPNNYVLHSLLVLDVDREGIPVAFLLSNRSDEGVIDIFLRCIQERVGQINTAAFMSDIAPSYYDSWKKWMGPTESHFYCSWHVHEDWRTNLSKITIKSKQEIIRKIIYDLMQELDEGTFEKKLKKFLTQSDPDVQEFLNYFVEYFSDTALWAFCYQKYALVETNTHLKVLHWNLKRVVASGTKMKSLLDCLNYIDNFIVLKKKEDEIKEIRGKSTTKRQNLRKSHRDAAKYLENVEVPNIEILANGSWLVGSFSSFQMYAVREYEIKECSRYNSECHLRCSLCNICYHEYSCDCIEFTTRQNMCKHVHALGIYLKDSNMSSMAEEMDVVLYEDVEYVPCGGTNTLANETPEDVGALENLKVKMKGEFNEVLNYANSTEDLRLVQSFVLKPMKMSLTHDSV